MRAFTDLFVDRPVLATVVSLLIVLLGLRAYDSLNVREFPKTESAVVQILTPYVGADAQLVKGFITTPLEQVIASADGIDYMESTSVQGVSLIKAHLRLNYDSNAALTQINTKIKQVRNQLPAGAEDPQISVTKGKSTAAMYISFASTALDPNQLTDYLSRVVQPQLETVGGVESASVLGAKPIAMRIWLQPDRMAALGVTANDVRQALQNNNFLAAVGATKGAMTAVSLNATTDLHTVKQFGDLAIRKGGNAIVRLRDVAKVEKGAESYSSWTRFDGKPAQFIAVSVLPTANPLSVIQHVRDQFQQIKRALPSAIHASINYDSTRYIHESIREVLTTMAEALAIVILVIFLFLGTLRAVIVPALAIPISLVGTGFLMLAMGFSINVLTLLSLVLAIGLVVDDAIVVVENVHRHIERGEAPLAAAKKGAHELGTPIIAMTLTLVAVYAPIGFIGGLTGSLFTEFAYTLAGAVLVSGVVALTLSPMVCSKVLKQGMHEHGFPRLVERTYGMLRRGYEASLRAALGVRWLVLLFGVVALAGCWVLFQGTPKQLAPKEDQGFLVVTGTGAPDASVDQMAFWSTELMGIMGTIPEAEHFFLRAGASSDSAQGGNSVFAGMVLKPWNQRKRSVMQIQPQLQGKLAGIAGLNTVAFNPPALPGAGGGLPLQFVVGTVRPAATLEPVAKLLLRKAQQSGLFLFAKSDLHFDRPQAVIHIDRNKAAALGIPMKAIAADLATFLGGNYVNHFSIDGRSYRVIPQVVRKDRLDPSQLANYYVRAGDGKQVALANLVEIKTEARPRQLNRFQQFNAVTISGVPAPGVSMGQALGFLKQQMQQNYPTGFKIDYAGVSRQFTQAGSKLSITFGMAIIVIFLVLAALYESFRDPAIILVAVPMSVFGALIFLAGGFATINVYTQIGLITLIGLISKHGILVVRFANDLQTGEGLDRGEAVVRAATIRLRPVLMTVLAMVAGVVPLLVATGPGAAGRFSMGIVIAAGLGIGTLFTLYVLPAFYTVLAKDRSPEAAAHVTDHDTDHGAAPQRT